MSKELEDERGIAGREVREVEDFGLIASEVSSSGAELANVLLVIGVAASDGSPLAEAALRGAVS